MEKKFAPPKTYHGVHSSPVTACNSRRHAMKHVPRASPFCLDAIDLEFVQIGLVQLLQSVKTTNSMLHTSTHTDRLIKYWHPVRTPVLVER